MVYSKLYIFTELNANDVKIISINRQMLDLSKMYTYGTINAIFVEIKPYFTNIKMTLVVFLFYTIYLHTTRVRT